MEVNYRRQQQPSRVEGLLAQLMRAYRCSRPEDRMRVDLLLDADVDFRLG